LTSDSITYNTFSNDKSWSTLSFLHIQVNFSLVHDAMLFLQSEVHYDYSAKPEIISILEYSCVGNQVPDHLYHYTIMKTDLLAAIMLEL
jgi:hypothetical protein